MMGLLVLIFGLYCRFRAMRAEKQYKTEIITIGSASRYPRNYLVVSVTRNHALVAWILTIDS
jgi:hypothetical protein